MRTTRIKDLLDTADRNKHLKTNGCTNKHTERQFYINYTRKQMS